jgi:hypothetical protein
LWYQPKLRFPQSDGLENFRCHGARPKDNGFVFERRPVDWTRLLRRLLVSMTLFEFGAKFGALVLATRDALLDFAIGPQVLVFERDAVRWHARDACLGELALAAELSGLAHDDILAPLSYLNALCYGKASAIFVELALALGGQ